MGGSTTLVRLFDETGVVVDGCRKLVVTNIEQAVAVIETPQQGPIGIQGPQGIQGESAMYWADYEVDANMLAEGWVFLPTAPVDPLKVEVVIQHIGTQRAGVDFFVTGNSLWWVAMGMEAILEEGDFFTVRYV
jgi:hypothetical protein